MNPIQYIDSLLNERYSGSMKFGDTVYPIYENISSSEVDEVLKEEGYGGIRFGVKNPNTICGWNIEVLHSTAERFLHEKFWLKLDYLRHATYMSLAENSSIQLFKNNFGGSLAKKFKDILPSKVTSVKDIDGNIVWTWDT